MTPHDDALIAIPRGQLKQLQRDAEAWKYVGWLIIDMGFGRLTWPKPAGFSKLDEVGKAEAFFRFLETHAADFDRVIAKRRYEKTPAGPPDPRTVRKSAGIERGTVEVFRGRKVGAK